MKKIKLGLLGAGICANNFHLPALTGLRDRFELVALAGANEEQNAAYAKKAGIDRVFTDYRALMEDRQVEAVISSYPYALNEELLACAKASGKHILVEKPIAESIEKGLRAAALDDGSVVMGVAENWLYWPVIDLVRSLLEAGEIGRPLLVQNYSYYNIDLENEYLRGNAWRRSATGGMILDRTIHAAALMRGIFGPVARACGLNTGVRAQLGPVDTMAALLEYRSGVKGSILTSASAPGLSFPFGLTILGERGTIALSQMMTRVELTREGESRVFTADNGDGGYTAEFLDFYRSIVEGVPFKSDLRSACNDLFAVLTPLETPGIWRSFTEEGAGE